jgi:hypothetical protein
MAEQKLQEACGERATNSQVIIPVGFTNDPISRRQLEYVKQESTFS